MLRVLALVALMLLVAAIAACNAGSERAGSDTGSSSNSGGVAFVGGVSIEAEYPEYGDPRTVVTGKIRNSTDEFLNYVQVSCQLYGSDGVQVGSSLDNTGGLAEGKTWAFKVLFWDVSPNSELTADCNGSWW